MIRRFGIFAIIGVFLTAPVHALIIDRTLLENAYIEALPGELLSHGGISVLTQPISGVGSVTNFDPTFFGTGDESDEELRTREGSSISSVSYLIHIGDIEVDLSPGRVYVVDAESGEITFGDGQTGDRPPEGDAVVATYRTGGGSTGNIGNSFILDPLDLQPFLIPLLDFDTDEQGVPDYRLVFWGLSAIDLIPTDIGLLVTGIRPVGIPEPGTLGMLAVGLLGLALIRRRST